MLNRKFIILWFFISLVFAFIINQTNLYFVKKANVGNESAVTNYGYSLSSVDDVWYLPQIKNYKAGKGFTIDPKVAHYDVRRTPVYPLFYGIHYLIFGEKLSFFFIRISQLLLAALGVILLGLSVLNISSNISWAKWTIYLSAFNPFFYIYCYYTLSESLSPFCVILAFYFFTLAIKEGKYLFYFLTGTSSGLMILTRPPTGLVLAAIILTMVILKRNEIRQLFLQGTTMCTGLILVFTPWVIHNYIVTKGELIFLEKFYDGDSLDYGNGHVYFKEWISSWTNEFHVYSSETFSPILRGQPDKIEENIDWYINRLPKYVTEINEPDKIRNALRSLGECHKFKDSVMRANPNLIPEMAGCEEIVKNNFSALTKEFREKSPLRYHIINPLNKLRELVFNSCSYAYGSLNPVGGKFNFAQYIIKSGMYLLNLLLYFSLLFVLLKKNISAGLKIPIVTVTILNFIFFAFVFRYIELRYVLPIYPFLFISLSFVMSHFGNIVLSRFAGKSVTSLAKEKEQE